MPLACLRVTVRPTRLPADESAASARLAPPARRRPVEPELAGGVAHRQLDGPRRVDGRIVQRDLDRQAIQKCSEREGERVHVGIGVDLTTCLTFAHHGRNRVTPSLVELDPVLRDLGMPERLRPQVEPESPGSWDLTVTLCDTRQLDEKL